MPAVDTPRAGVAEFVPAGPYFGFTLAQLETELGNLIARRQRLSGLIGHSGNGHSYQREGTATEMRSLDKQLQDLHDALHYLRPDMYQRGPQRRAVIAFA